MTYLLLLVNSAGEATTVPLRIRELREFPGGEGLSVHFRPVRNDLLFESAKAAGGLAYRILSGEGIVRSQLWVEYELPDVHVNVTGRSSDLLFALALITARWPKVAAGWPAIAATGVLDTDNAALAPENPSAVQSVKHTAEKVAAAVSCFRDQPDAVIFYPASDAASVAAWSAGNPIPTHIRLHPVESLEEALSVLGITLEKVYLGNPFRGLEYFDYEHRAIFFGRDSEVGDVLAQLLRRESAGSPGLLVDGASGSGKSSFLRAGILPALVHPGSQPANIEQALQLRPVHDSVRRAIWRVGLLPNKADEAKIAQSILECWQTLPELAGCVAGEAATLDDLAKQRREHWPASQRFVWLLDQFEELFALGLPDSLVETFGRFLMSLQSDGVWTLASIRADAVSQLKQHSTLRHVFGSNEGQYYLASIRATALDDVINRPALAAGLKFGMGPSGKRLDQNLREDAYQDRGNALPLLQFTLFELYQRRSGRELTYAAYEQLGGLEGSVSTTADAVLKAEAVDDRAVSHVFRSLVTVDESGGASRRYAPIAELGQNPAQKGLLLRLVQARLCVTDQREGQAVVAFAHEALLRTWPELIDWLKQEAGLLQTRELAQRETRLWQQHAKSDDWLASPDKLTAFEQLRSAGIALSEPVRNFIERSAWRVRRTTRIKQVAVSLIALLAIVATGAGWIASRKQHEAEYQTAETLKAQAGLLTQAAAQRLKDSDVAGAQGVILEVLTDPRFARGHSPAAVSVFQEVRAADVQVAILSGHRDRVSSAVYSADGARIVTASIDKTARIWEAYTGAQLAVLSGHESAINSANFSPDGRSVVTASGDKTARIWDARTYAEVAVLSGHADSVGFAAYSPDGNRIVTASADKTARIWDAHSGAQLAVLSGHDGGVNSAVFSPDGSCIVTASQDKSARIWDAHTGRQLSVLSGHDRAVRFAAYSSDGGRIVTASLDESVRIWDARTAAQTTLLTAHGGFVFSAVFSPDGNGIVTSLDDKTARIWDARTAVQLLLLSAHSSYVLSAAYSPDGTHIVTASDDGTARIWDARPRPQLTTLSGHEVGVYFAGFSPDGTRIVTASLDRTARIWNSSTGEPLTTLTGHTHYVLHAAYSPDGTRVVTASADKTARIWDAHTGSQLLVLPGHTNLVLDASYSPDGSRIVTASTDNTARVWDARTGAQLMQLSHANAVSYAAFSPDGTRIVTASRDRTARIWEASSGAQLAVLTGHTDFVFSAAFSPDSTRVVTASADKTARIWDARTGAEILVLSANRKSVNSASYSPDGSRIVTASDDRSVRIWDASTGVQLAVLAGHTDEVDSAGYSPDGTRIVSASGDKTARIWDSRVPATFEGQILWVASADADPLSKVDRIQLGLPTERREGNPGSAKSACDQAAAAIYDPERLTPGTVQSEINGANGTLACRAEIPNSNHLLRSDYQLGRALLANHDAKGAKDQFEFVANKGYRAGLIDLGNLLVDASAQMLDPDRAISLYEHAWREHVSIAAYELGRLFEMGAPVGTTGARANLLPDLTKAWSWYQKGADVNEPNALARLAERDERNALAEQAPSKRNALLLQSFRFYAAAAERAHDDDWPDEAWKHWRYRRATLARLLAREGMMQQVADAYAAVRKQ